MKAKKYYTATYGCQMNVYDTAVLSDMLNKKGYSKTNEIKSADIIIINGCSVREHAVQRALGFVESIKNGLNEDAKLFITGCLASSLRRIPEHADALIGPNSYRRIFDAVENSGFSDYSHSDEISDYTEFVPDTGITAYATIMKGCNNFCSYCIVPYLRGKESSFSPESIFRQLRISSVNSEEILLLGQNVNSYRYGETDFPKLLEMTALSFPDKRIRYMTSHPKDLSERLIDVMAEYGNICNGIHLPVQSGSDRILKMMKRNYTYKSYMKIVQYAKKRLKNPFITTDIMVGFPTETEADFNDTLSLVREASFDDAFTYRYSRRPFTCAALYDDTDDVIKAERLNLLIEEVSSIKIENAKSQINKRAEVLIERRSKKSQTDFLGRDEGGRSVIVRGEASIRERVSVIITGISGITLIGEREA